MEPKFSVPFSEPDIGREEVDAVLKVLESGWVTEGKVTEEFQNLLSKYLSSDVSVLNNGSSALMSALIANEIKPGDNVIVPAFTYVASASVPKILGANVIVSDVDPISLNTTPELLEDLVKKFNPKAVIVVDIAGLPSDIDGFVELSKKYNFKLIEDAAQSFGAVYKNKKLGSFNHTTIFSFQIAKQLTTVEGGCVATTDENVIKKIQKIKDYGRTKVDRYVHDFLGTNFRTTDIQSAIGIIQLKKVEKYISLRNKIAAEYKKRIKELHFQKIPPFVTRHSYMLFFAFAENRNSRDQILNKLVKNGIDARKSWTPIHMQPYDLISKSSDCSNAEKIFETGFTLPIFNRMKEDQVSKVIDVFTEM